MQLLFTAIGQQVQSNFNAHGNTLTKGRRKTITGVHTVPLGVPHLSGHQEQQAHKEQPHLAFNCLSSMQNLFSTQAVSTESDLSGFVFFIGSTGYPHCISVSYNQTEVYCSKLCHSEQMLELMTTLEPSMWPSSSSNPLSVEAWHLSFQRDLLDSTDRLM